MVRSVRLSAPLVPCIALLALILELFMPFRLWRYLFFAAGSLSALSAVWAFSLSRGIALHRSPLQGRPRVGDRLVERWSLSNSSPLPAPWLVVTDSSTVPGHDTSRCVRLGGRTALSWSVELLCSRRGGFSLGPVTLLCGDPLGLFSVTIEYPQAERILILPHLLPWDPLPGIPAGVGGERDLRNFSPDRSACAGDVREYAPGDSLNRIHWRTSARQGELFVKLFDPPAEGDLFVVADLQTEVQHGEGFAASDEQLLTLVATIAHHALAKGARVALLASSDPMLLLPGLPGRNRERILQAALAQAGRGSIPLADLLGKLPRFLPRGAELCLVTPSVESDWTDALLRGVSAEFRARVFLLPPSSGRDAAEAIRERLGRRGIPVFLPDKPFLRPDSSGDASAIGNGRKAMGTRLSPPRNLVVPGLFTLCAAILADLFSEAIHTASFPWLFAFLLSGVFCGILVARTQVPRAFAATTALLLGVLLLLVQIPGVTGALHRTATRLGGISSLAAIPSLLAALGSEVGHILRFMIRDITAAASGRPLPYTAGVGFAAETLLWIGSVRAGARLGGNKDPMGALFPLGVLAAGTVWYREAGFGHMAVVFAAALLASAAHRMNRLATGSRVPGGTVPAAPRERNLLTAALIVCLVGIAGLPFSLPKTALTGSLVKYQIVTFDRTEALARSLGLFLPGEKFEPSDKAPRLPREKLIAPGAAPSDRIVATVVTGELRPVPPGEMIDEEAPLHYWKSRSYDRYDGRGWNTGALESIPAEAGERIPSAPDPDPDRYLFISGVTLSAGTERVILAIGDLVSVDRPHRPLYRTGSDLHGSGTADPVYRAVSSEPAVSPSRTRHAEDRIPDWIRARYLELPEAVSQRVRDLARRIAGDESDPYDRAKAIERYLRGFPYTLDVESVPPGAEVADFFLFRLRKGYCDYFATAMAVLARSVGLPSRLAVGYLGRNYDYRAGRYELREMDAHSWTEIYFAGTGWVAFEPTSAYGERTEARKEAGAGAAPGTGIAADAERVPGGRFPVPLLPVFALFAGLTVALFLVAMRFPGLLFAAAPPTALYRDLRTRLTRAGLPVVPGTTPRELLALAGKMPAACGARENRFREEIRRFEQFIGIYRRARYGPRPLTGAERAELRTSYRGARRYVSFLTRCVRRSGRTSGGPAER